MTRLTMQSDYMVELSEDQQEVVSGGLDIAEVLGTNFMSDDEFALVKTDQASGRNGTSISQTLLAANSETNTSGNKAFAISTDGMLNLGKYFGV